MWCNELKAKSNAKCGIHGSNSTATRNPRTPPPPGQYLSQLQTSAVERVLNTMSLSTAHRGSAIIRIITPESARQPQSSHLLYNSGEPVSLDLTLRALKIGIAHLLKMSNLSLPRRNITPMTNKCNCDLAQKIADNGTWEMLRCRLHGTDRPSCAYPHEPLPPADCVICLLPLTQRCNACKDEGLYNPACPFVINAGCNHNFHHHCYINKPGASCPSGCSLRSFLSVNSDS